MTTSNKRPRVLLLAPQPFFTARGTPLNVREMLNTLAHNNYEVFALAYPFGEDICIPKVKILRSLKLPFINSVPVGPSLSKLLLDIPFSLKALYLSFTHKFDLFHGIEEAGFLAGVLGLIHRKPFIVDVDSCMHDQLKTSGFIKSEFLLKRFVSLEKFFLQRSTAVITVCQALSEEVKRLAPLAQIHQIEDFPLEDQACTSTPQINLRQDFNISDSRQIILYLGNFEPYQGIDLLINGFKAYLSEKQLSQQPINAQLVLVGGDHAGLMRYKTLSTNLGLNDYTTFTGPVPPEASSTILNQADVLVSPRLSGTNTPLKIYSYMQANKPIIVTDIHSHTQVVDAQSVYLSQTNPKSFQEKLIAALDDSPEGRRRNLLLAKKAKYLVETKYNRQIFRDNLSKLYQKVLGY